ncbi:PREDICTED: mitochondrial import receptor subunit TOM40 homolog 1 [Rhagoletis zephyria]|uniref:mitochondrial import receptor subunit TOM40 homolog 1 n=2 Tax=Rhagoletis zephyria TaxID=28612 RepID=UPI000811536A|nr:PREDICTED: mitochondrial import receptor subunit TOM40 homolog 1 [Rhagoletis zephyria]
MTCDWCPQKCTQQFPACFQLYPGTTYRKNPGSIHELHKLAQRIKPTYYDGIELDYAHRLAANKTATCNWVWSHTRPSGFRFGGIYSLRLYEDFLQTPTITADINPTTLASNVSIVFYPHSALRLEAAMQRAAEDVELQTQTTIELTRPSTTLTCNMYNVRSNSGRSTISLMRSITESWALGAELLLEWTDPRSLMADTAIAARYSKYNYQIAASASRQGIDISYWQRIHERIQMATLLAWHRKTEKTIATICYQWDFDDAVVRSMVNSDLSVGFQYYRSLPHIPCGMGLSALISLVTNRFAFGLKFVLDPSGQRRGD